MINANELKQAIKQSAIDIPDSEIDRIIDEVDYFGNKKINYTEFLVATLDVKNFLDENMLKAIFNQFDTDNTGKISEDNIIAAMNKIGHGITQAELKEIMSEHDIAKNGVITMDEFKLIFYGIDDIHKKE